MSTQKNLQRSVVLAAAAGVLALGGASTIAVPLSWDPGITGAATGGATTGETTEWKAGGATTWWDGTNNVVWANGNDATFTGTAGNVRLGGNNATISAGTVNFGVSGYTIDLKDFTDNTANNLTVTGLSGSSATITNTTGTTRNVTLNNAADQTWSGTITSQRIIFIKQGVGTLGFSGTLPAGFGGNTLDIQNGKVEFTGTVDATSSGVVNIGATGTLDLRGNALGIANANDGFRRLSTVAGSTLTSSTGSTADIRFGFGGQTHDVNGTVSGDLRFRFNRGGNEILNLGGNNSFTGGILFNNLFSGSGTVNANHQNALGTGPISFSNSNGTARLNMRTATASVGSLTGSGAGTRQVVLGNTGIDTTLTINQTTDGTFTGVISEFAGQTGSVTKTGAAALTLTGANTYTGDTTVNAGSLVLATGGELRFKLTDSDSNQLLIVSSGSATLNGIFRIDASALTSASAGLWDLVDGSVSYGASFGLAFVGGPTFTNDGGGFYSSGEYVFNTADGVLAVPEPTGLALLGLAGVLLGRRNRSEKRV